MSDRYLRAYYWTFETTGNDTADAMLESVARAGKGFHCTSDWGESWPDENGPCAWEKIQIAAQEAADELDRKDKVIGHLFDGLVQIRDTLQKTNGTAFAATINEINKHIDEAHDKVGE